jgi:hypothetical protein
MREAPSRGFDFCSHMRDICQDFVQRLPELSHIDMEGVAVSASQARQPGPYGIYASLTPMRFEGGARAGKRRGRYYKSQVVVNESGREMLYILTFYLPRFMDVSLREKLITIVHELWHISPDFDGDMRRHEGRCYAHTGSRQRYDEAAAGLVDRWMSRNPPRSLYTFLELDFCQLQRLFGPIYGVRYARPKLLPILATEAQQLNRNVPRPKSEE